MEFKISLSSLMLSLLFLSLVTTFTMTYTTHTYIIFLFFLFISFIKISKNMTFPKINIGVIPILFLFTWLYGFLLGIINENKTNNVIANFAGMSLYLLYFLFNSFEIDRKIIVKILIISSLFNVVLSFIYGLYTFTQLDNLSNYAMTTGQIRLYYFVNMSTYYILLIYSFSVIIMPNKYKNTNYNYISIFNHYGIAYFLFLLSLFAILFSASKGFTLGVIVLLTISFFLLNKSYIFKNIINRKIIYIFMSLFISIIFLILLNYEKLFTMIFSSEDLGNQVRYKQFYTIYNDLTFFGKGLGAEIPSNMDGNTYGFELSFMNVIHKFGIFSIFIFFGYILTFYLIFKRFKIDKVNSLISLSCMGYLLPSIGNPILFAPTNVILHVCALLILEQKEKNV